MTRTIWDEQSPSLRAAIVCYADILGFGNLTKCAFDSDTEAEFLLRIKSSLSRAYDEVLEAATISETGPPIFEMKALTDNIVIAHPLRDFDAEWGEPELGNLLLLFARVQSGLVKDGFFLRGGIAFGQHYQDKDIAYGDALLKAVALDESGGSPKVAIESSVEPLVLMQISSYATITLAPHYSYLFEDPTDNRMFVNYLWAAFDNFPDDPIDFQLLSSHRENVLRGLEKYESNTSVRAKYEWLATYHNYACQMFVDQYSAEDNEAASWDEVALLEEIQRVPEYTIPAEVVLRARPLRTLDVQRLDERIGPL